jgi:hypothetical protein
MNRDTHQPQTLGDGDPVVRTRREVLLEMIEQAGDNEDALAILRPLLESSE